MDLKKLYIDGQWVAPLSGQYIDVENPATKETFATVAAAGEQDVAAAALAAAKAFPAWAARPMEERIDFMRKLLKELIQFEPQMVDAVVNELGIPVSFVKTNHIGYQFVRTQSYIDLAPKLPLVEKTAPVRCIPPSLRSYRLHHAVELSFGPDHPKSHSSYFGRCDGRLEAQPVDAGNGLLSGRSL